MTAEDLLARPGVIAVWQWTMPAGARGFGTPQVRLVGGKTKPELAELGALYLELLAHLANFEASLLDRRSSRSLFSPVEAIAFEGSRYTVVATGNRLAVVLDNRERPDFWELAEAMVGLPEPAA